MKDHVEIGHLTKYDAFRINRDQVMNLEIWFKIHTNVSNFYLCFGAHFLRELRLITEVFILAF